MASLSKNAFCDGGEVSQATGGYYYILAREDYHIHNPPYLIKNM